MGRTALLILVLFCCLDGRAAEPAADAGNPVLAATVLRVSDGDSLRVSLQSGPATVRLFGIDAPERDQPGGRAARAALLGRVGGREVLLDVRGQDRYDRLTAVVLLGDEDLNGWLIDQGHAWAYRRYLDDPGYCEREHAARVAGRGLWSPETKALYAPWEWRNLRPGQWDRITDYRADTAATCIAAMPGGSARAPASAPTPAPPSAVTPRGPAAAGTASQDARQPAAPACLIKGNISRSGRIYHLPGSPAYARTHIDTALGERWFCTESEALAAGWRPPRR